MDGFPPSCSLTKKGHRNENPGQRRDFFDIHKKTPSIDNETEIQAGKKIRKPDVSFF
jgi:hypothetical protein